MSGTKFFILCTFLVFFPLIVATGTSEQETKYFSLKIAQNIAKAQKHTVAVVEGEGMAHLSKDLGLTRDLAILRAKQNAIEQLGVGIDSQTIVDMGMTLDDIIKVQTFGLVKACEVLSEGPEGDQYKVKIKAWVIPKEEEKEVLENLFAHRSMAIQAMGEGSSKIEQALLKHLTKGFYFIVDPGVSRWTPDYNLIINSSINFSQETYGIRSYHANCEIKLVQRPNGKILISESMNGIIFGLNKRQAINGLRPDQFFKKIVSPLIEGFMKRLNKVAHIKEHQVKVIIQGLPSYKKFREFCRLIRGLRLGVKEVFNEKYDAGTGEVTVNYVEKTDYLAAMISFRSEYKIEKATGDQIEIVYQGS